MRGPAGTRPGSAASALLLVAVATVFPIAEPAAQEDAAADAQESAVASTQQEAARYLQRGVELLATGQAAEAIGPLERAVALRPDDPVARYQLGLALFTVGRAADAVEHLEIALTGVASPGPVHFLLGQVWLDLDELEVAHDALEAAAAARPGYAPIDFYRAELCYRLGRVDAARERLEALAAAAPSWAAPRVRSGTLALEQGDPSEALRWFRSALEITAEDPDLWMRLGTALVEDEQAYEALAAYRKAAELAPDRASLLASVAVQLINLDEREEAMAALDAVLAEDPDHGVIRYHRAKLESMAGEHALALAEVEEALVDLRGSAAGRASGADGISFTDQAALLRAEILMKLGREDEALEPARDLLAREPDYPEALFLLGNALVRRRDRSGTVLLERFKVLSDAREHRRLGDQFRLRSKDPERARTEYEEALRSLPDDAGSLLGLGAVQRQSGEAEQAVETLRRAREAGAGGAEWYREWVLALHTAGRTAEARQAWQEAREGHLELGSEVRAIVLESLAGC